MKTPLFVTSSTAPSNSADRYAGIAAAGSNVTAYGTLTTGSVANATYMPFAGTISSLYVRFPVGLTQGTYVVTLMKGTATNAMSATALTVTVSTSSGTDVTDLVNSVSFSAGDYLAWRIVPSGTPNTQSGSQTHINCVMEATTAGRSALFSVLNNGTAANFGIVGAGQVGGLTVSTSSVAMPTSGTVSKMFVRCNAAPGTGTSRTITLRRGTAVGGLTDTTLTATVSDTGTTAEIDLGGSPLSLAEGDLLSLAQTVSGTPLTSSVYVSIEFTPTTSGHAPVFGVWTGSMSVSLERFGGVSGAHTPAGETLETGAVQPVPVDLTVKKIRFNTVTPPGSGKTRTVMLHKDGADTALTADITTETTDTTTADVSVTRGQQLSYSHVPTSTPAASVWSSVSSVMVVSEAPPAINFSPSDKAGQVFEGIRNTSKVVVGGSYSGTPTNVQVSLWDAPTGGNIVSAWVSATTQTGGVYSHTFSGLPVSTSAVYQRVRDNGGTATLSSADLYVGAVIIFWGQSQCARLFSDGHTLATPSAGMKISVMTPSSYTNVGTASVVVTPLTPSTGALTGITGSGIISAANMFHSKTAGTIPAMFVQCAYGGTSIEFWIDNKRGDYVNEGSPGTNTTTLWGTSPTTGQAWFMATAAKYQATAVIFMQGTSDLGDPGGYAARMDTLKAKWEALLTGVTTLPLFPVLPHQRSNDTNNTWEMRQVQIAKAKSGSTWRLLGYALDHQMNTNGDPHQAPGSTGNFRLGTVMGNGLAKLLYDVNIDILGPQIVSVEFTSSACTAIDITYDRDIETADADTTDLPGHFLSTDNGSSFPGVPSGYTANIVSARVLRMAKTTGSWTAGQLRYDFLRGIPFNSTTGASDYAGDEVDVEANYLAKIVRDTTSFDGGRGMLAAPVGGTGTPVALPVSISATVTGGNTTTSTVRFRQA